MTPLPPTGPPAPDDPLARAEEALRRFPVPEGPDDATLARTLAALRAAAERPEPRPKSRRRTLMFATLKIAAAALVAATGLLAFRAGPRAEANAEFAEAAAKLRDARTLSFRFTLTIAGIDQPQSARTLYKEPGHARTEPEPAGGPVAVLDSARGRMLVLDAAHKTAMILDGLPKHPEKGDNLATSMIDDFRRLAGKEGEPAGEKTIGGVRARGFKVKEEGQDLVVWVDPQAKLPVLIDVKGRVGGKDFTGSFSDFRLDPPLDDDLFRLEPPEGYKVQKAEAKLTTPEGAVVTVLRAYTENSGGRFPTDLHNIADFQKVFSTKEAKKPLKEEKPEGLPGPEAFQLATAMARVGLLPRELKGPHGYKGEGAKLGEADKVVFWYKPEGATKYRAVFGDLHVGDVAADQLPEKPKP